MSTRLARFTALGLAAAAVLAAACTQSDRSIPSNSPPASASTLVLHQEAEAMTSAGGCTSTRNTYAGLLCKSDAVSGPASFAQAGRYHFVVHGASSVATIARAGLYLDTVRVAGLSWTGTTFTDVVVTWDVTTPGTKQVKFLMEVDDGSSDTYIDWYELYYDGATPPPPEPPAPPADSAWASGSYRNLFKEWDPTITDAQVQTKLNAWWDSLFASTDDTKRVYYTFGTNTNGALAYIKDVGDNDIRSEGMSYGMMIAVQMNKQAEFNALWNFAKSNMQQQSGSRQGYFSWQVSTSGSIMDQNPASDGESYFATALFFAANRWGNGTGIYNYSAEANAILDTMLHKEDVNAGVVDGVSNMFNRTQKMVVFVPYYNSANFTDPSYHLPAFYELWGRWAAGWNGQTGADRQFWLDAAATSRAFFVKAANTTTGLSPDYAEFTGVPNTTGNHADFRFDAWRVGMNWAVDNSWWRYDTNEPVLADRLQAFLASQGITSYGNQFTLAGSQLSTDHSPGLVACTGVASLAATNARRLDFVRELWNLSPPTGQWRYYDGMLSFMSLLHASGNFKIWKPGGTGTTFALTVTKAGTGTGTVTSNPAGVSCGATCSASFAAATNVTLTATPDAGSTFTGWSGACTGTGTCAVAMSAAQSVTATFAGSPTPYALTVTKAGTGTGTVSSTPVGVSCGTTCSASFAASTSVTLTATPDAGSTFAGWSGACSGTGTCAVAMSAAQSVTATFTANPNTYTLTVTKAGTGTGTVSSTPAGVSCGTTCSASFAASTSVTLTATPDAGSTFAGWSGACSGTGTCAVAMSAAQSVTATFTANPTTYALSVTRGGAGTGTVSSTPAGVSCGTTCSASFASGTVVTLTATAGSGSSLTGWSGACSGTAATCTVTMSAARSVTATFDTTPVQYTLTVTRSGTGSGTVSSTPTGVSCGTTCSASYASGTSVTLTATAASGSTFTGFSGACSGTAACVVSMTAARSVTANFDPASTGTTPCANPVTLTSGNSGNFNTTGAACYRTSANVAGWGCYNMDGRTVSVNNVAVTCGATLPAKWSDGYYYFAFTAGQYTWAGFYYW
jgi:endo-1,4-beta-D-glucanase Y